MALGILNNPSVKQKTMQKSFIKIFLLTLFISIFLGNFGKTN